MHDTAFRIGTLAMNIYVNLEGASILEVGAQSINGSLRDNALPTTKYIGVDVEDGDGVDIVVKPGERLPIDDQSFDLVMSTSVFEHDACFWMTFLEMCRTTTEGGYIYINAPSNGVIHRYPQDNWRFYPDAGQALAHWATSQGYYVSLVESFVADREDDIWNDFVAVFRKGPITKSLPKVFLYEHVPCSNVRTWKSKEILSPRDEPEDLAILMRATQRAEQAEQSLAEASVQVGNVREELTLREGELLRRQNDVEQTRAELANTLDRFSKSEEKLQIESALRCEAETMSANWKRLHERAEVQIAEISIDLTEIKTMKDRIENRLRESEAYQESLLAQVRRDEERIEQLRRDLDIAQRRCAERERRLSAHFEETAILSQLLLKSEQQASKEVQKVRRMRDLLSTLSRTPRWWALLPRAQQARLEQKKLHRLGLFDAESYLRKNPDVAAAGMDPLTHLMIHGIDEDRQF